MIRLRCRKAPRPGGFPRGEFADDRAAALLHLGAQAAVGHRVGFVDGGAQHPNGGGTGGHGGLVGLTVQPIGQTAHKADTRLGQLAADQGGGLHPVAAGAAAADHGHGCRLGKGGYIAGAVEHRGRVGKGGQTGGIVLLVLAEHPHAHVMAAGQKRRKPLRGQLFGAAQLGRSEQAGHVLFAHCFIKLSRGAVKGQHPAAMGRARSQHRRKPKPFQLPPIRH